MNVHSMREITTKGFTLLELIVSVGLFSVVVMIASGAYLSLIALDREVRLTNELVTNLSFAVDSMSRGIRTGQYYDCNPSDADGNSTTGQCHQFSYTDSNGCRITYENTNGTLTQTTNGTNCTEGSDIPLTDARIQLSQDSPEGLTFYVRGAGTSSALEIQPSVVFVLHGTIEEVEGKETSFTIQGQATQRFIDL